MRDEIDLPLLIPEADIVAHYGITHRALKEAVKSGRLKRVRIGRKNFHTSQAIAAWFVLEENTGWQEPTTRKSSKSAGGGLTASQEATSGTASTTTPHAELSAVKALASEISKMPKNNSRASLC
ncbi:MAG TPA: hypothetical protein VMU01_02640 [Rhizomicrobium sp.]|nr:hypothetical protein [Rhizomicrobium sp.]